MKSTVVKTSDVKSAAINSVPTKKENLSIRILKIATCPSVSGRSTLTYHIGCKGDLPGNPDIQFRIHASSGRGFFSKEWISTNAIQKVFEKNPASVSVTSTSLNLIFHGKSVNTSGFLLAVLKAEGLIAAMKDKRRYYQRVDSNEFVTEIKNLMASSIALKTDDKPVLSSKVRKKTIQTGKAQKT